MTLRTLWLALLLLACVQAQAQVTGVVIVRHAEKADDGSTDPALTEAGTARARALAESLEHAELAGLIASQYRRTLQTLSPLSRRSGLPTEVIPATSAGIGAHVAAVADRVRSSEARGVIVIAGHSNTVPALVEALSGRPAAPMDESEYDRLYLLLPAREGMTVIATRYGPDRD
jgi:broad specificity phosphatase PhoE